MSRRAAVLLSLGAVAVVVAVVGALALLLPRLPVRAPSPTTPAAAPERTAAPAPAPTPTREPAAPVLPGAVRAAPPEGARPLASVLAPLLADRALGSRVGVAVLELPAPTAVGTPAAPLLAYASDARAGLVPASTLKVLTSVAVLQALGPDARFTTRVLLAGTDRLVLVGGGDPLLTRAGAGAPRAATRLSDLADATAAALASRAVPPPARLRLVVDDTYFTGPAVDPDWEPHYVPTGAVAPVSALAVDGGRVAPGELRRSADPAVAAGRRFAAMLADRGVAVGEPARGAATPGAVELAAVRSARLATVVEHVLATSDNDGAEVLGRHLAFATGRPASFAGVEQALPEVLAGLGLDLRGTALRDASGLSRRNRLTAAAVAGALALAAAPDRPALRPVVSGLPVAGFTGTLDERFEGSPALPAGSDVRAKTGSLRGVSALAGLVTSRDGTAYAFAVLADRVPSAGTLGARRALDRLAAALAGCGCSRTVAP